MGVIKRQSIKQSLVTYLGILIGTISTLFIYPLLEVEQYGDIQFVISIAAFFVPFLGLGLPSVAIHFFPYFKDQKEKRGRFLFILLFVTLLSLIVSLSLIYLFKNLVSKYFSQNAYLFLNYLPYILSISFCVSFITILQAYISNFNRIVVPSVIYNLTLKVFQPLLVIAYLAGFMYFTNILDGLVLLHIIIVLLTIYYLYHLGYLEINTKKIQTEKNLKKKIIDYSLFSILTNVGGSLALQIDKILIGLMVGARSLAIFQIPTLITEAIDVIRKAISGVSAPIISDSLKSNDMESVNSIYKKSALLQFTIGMFLLIGAWVCADDLFHIMPKGKVFAEGKIIILILGASRLIDMLTGTNTEIISFSQYYRMNLYFLLLLAVVNISSNYVLISHYGNVGAAYATLISMFFFNAAKLIFIYKKMEIHPFSSNMVGAIGIALFTLFLALLLPTIHLNTADEKMLLFFDKLSSILTIVLKGMVITIFYFILLWKFKISEDINLMIDNVLRKI